MEIKSLAHTSFDTIFHAFEKAFATYEIQLDKAQLQTMLKRRGFEPLLSFAAFEGDEIVAFTLNGTGSFNGIFTAYDTGTGTLAEHRGKGLATRIFEYSIPFLKEANIQQYLLEVLQHNTKAVSVYRNLGFEVTREFNYFVQDNKEIRNEIKPTNLPCVIKNIYIEKFNSLSEFWDFTPSWQNSFESIKRTSDDFICSGAFVDEKLVGYSVFEPVSGDITQIAVNKNYRRQGIASLLLQEIMIQNRYGSLKVVNTDISCTSITSFLESKNIALRGKQFEMVKLL